MWKPQCSASLQLKVIFWIKEGSNPVIHPEIRRMWLKALKCRQNQVSKKRRLPWRLESDRNTGVPGFCDFSVVNGEQSFFLVVGAAERLTDVIT